MYIYADESGHSGKNLFDANSPIFYQAALIVEKDLSAAIAPIVTSHCNRLGISRLHAKDILLSNNEIIAREFLKVLATHRWQYELICVDKQYLSTCVFVNTFFDSGENLKVPNHWYYSLFLRHSLCIFFERILTTEIKKDFWTAFLKADTYALSTIAQTVLSLLPVDGDARMLEVVRNALIFAHEHINNFTFIATRTRKSYCGHTPNMAAFGILLYIIKELASEYGRPTILTHDTQSEFSETMNEYHEIGKRVKISVTEYGFRAEEDKNGDATFALQPSSHNPILPIVDNFLWFIQRDKTPEVIEIIKLLSPHLTTHSLSLANSQKIVMSEHAKMFSKEMTEQDIAFAKELIQKEELRCKNNYNKFLNESK